MASRKYGIDLYRILSIFMVCVLHTLGQGGVLNASLVNDNQYMYKVFLLLEVVCFGAVDGFGLISGYVSYNKTPNYKKIIQMYFQVVFYSSIISLILKVSGINYSSQFLLWKTIFPLLSNTFWYFTAYVGLILFSPFLNYYLKSIDSTHAKRYFIVIFSVIFLIEILNLFAYSVLPVDPLTTKQGYSTIWLILLYILGALARISSIFKNQKSSTLVLIFTVSTLITWICTYIGYYSNLKYTSPTILLNSIVLLTLFSRLNISGKYISKITPFVFGVYLLQMNPIVYNKLLLRAFTFACSYNLLSATILTMVIAFAIMLTGIVIEVIRTKLFKILKIEKISDKVYDFLSKSIDIATKIFN